VVGPEPHWGHFGLLIGTHARDVDLDALIDIALESGRFQIGIFRVVHQIGRMSANEISHFFLAIRCTVFLGGDVNLLLHLHTLLVVHRGVLISEVIMMGVRP
jgi:hypothetical protein